MLADDLSLFVVIVGSRGAGKTLILSHFIMEQCLKAWAVKRWRQAYGKDKYPNRKVNNWSNYPAEALWTPRHVLLKPQPLDIEALITWAPEFHDGNIYFDEIDQVADRQDWMSTVAKFLNAGVQVQRHRNISFYCTIQSLSWLNARLQFQADIIIKARDLAFAPWGKERGLQPGEVARTLWIDKSGILTGYTYEERPVVYDLQFFGKRYWNAYHTKHEFDIVESKTKYVVKKPVREIDLTGENPQDVTDKEAVDNAILYFNHDKAGKTIQGSDFWDKAAEFGFRGTTQKWGKYLKEVGATTKIIRGYNRYVFDKAEVT
jgi:hypothetical protein